jgi:hypothetical protein
MQISSEGQLSKTMFEIDGIAIELAEENEGVRLTTHNGDNVILQDQTLISAENTVRENFLTVKTHYYRAEAGLSVAIDEHDLSIISLKIVLHYLYMYNMWRRMYMELKDRDLRFLTKDFENPSTGDMIISYFRNKYPEAYSGKCELLLGMSADEFRDYEKSRQEFHDMW